jgi:hypothetical protein
MGFNPTGNVEKKEPAHNFSGSSTFVMGTGRCRGATLDFSQTRECLVSRQANLCVLEGRGISPVPSGHFHLCHQYPARCAGLSRQANLCVLEGRGISPVPSGHFHLCHQYPARCAGLISGVAPRPPKGALQISPTINIEEPLFTFFAGHAGVIGPPPLASACHGSSGGSWPQAIQPSVGAA